MAMIAANGRLPDNAPIDMLDGANNRHATMSPIVETTTVTKLRVSGSEDKFRKFGKLLVEGMAWFMCVRSQGVFSRYEICRMHQ